MIFTQTRLNQLLSLKKAELIAIASEFLTVSSRKTVPDIVIIILENEQNALNESKENHLKIDKKRLKKILKSKKHQIVKIAKKYKDTIEIKSKTTSKALKEKVIVVEAEHVVIEKDEEPEVVEEEEKENVRIDAEEEKEEEKEPASTHDENFFRKDHSTGRWMYQDPHIMEDINYPQEFHDILVRLLNVDDLARHTLGFLTHRPAMSKFKHEDKDGKNARKYSRRHKAGYEYNKHQDQHFYGDHGGKHKFCTYQSCVDVFKKSSDFAHHLNWNPDQEVIEEMYPDINWMKLSATNFGIRIKRNETHLSFRFAPGWNSQVVTSEAGNSMKSSLFLMRDMILEKYAPIMKHNKYGAIKESLQFFEEKVNQIDDVHHIESLKYFRYLLGTNSVYFIDSSGEIVYDHYGSLNDSMKPSFYTCFFLLEKNDHSDSLRISPVRFGALKRVRKTSVYKSIGKIIKID